MTRRPLRYEPLRWLFQSFMLVLLVAACNSGQTPPPVPAIHANLAPARDTIAVTVTGLTPAERVARLRLVGPEGETVAPVTRRRARGVVSTDRRPSVGVTAEGGSASGVRPGLTLSWDLFDFEWARSETRARHSVTARFDVPPGYRKAPQDWRIEAVLIDPAGGERTRSIPAPRPGARDDEP